MQRNIIIGLNIVSLSIILSVYNFWNTLFLFLLVGAVPGTSISLSPLVMFGIIVITTGLIAYFAVQLIEAKQVPEQSLPKKRYGRI